MERMKQKRIGNKGFTLIEMIIVIAMMAVLLGIVGTQVTPYLNKAGEKNDMQIINSFAAAGATLYSLNKEVFARVGSETIVITLDSGIVCSDNFSSSEDKKKVATGLKELTGYEKIDELIPDMSSTQGKTVKAIRITYDLEKGTVTVQGYSDASTHNDDTMVLEPAIAYIKNPYLE